MFMIYTDSKNTKREPDTMMIPWPLDDELSSEGNVDGYFTSNVLTLADISNHPLLRKSRKMVSKEFQIRERIRKMTSELQNQIRDLVEATPRIQENIDHDETISRRDTAA